MGWAQIYQTQIVIEICCVKQREFHNKGITMVSEKRRNNNFLQSYLSHVNAWIKLSFMQKVTRWMGWLNGFWWELPRKNCYNCCLKLFIRKQYYKIKYLIYYISKYFFNSFFLTHGCFYHFYQLSMTYYHILY